MVVLVAGIRLLVEICLQGRRHLMDWLGSFVIHRSVCLKPSFEAHIEKFCFFFRTFKMTMPIYKLKSEHAASIGHVRELYAKVVNEFATLENTYPKTYVDE